MDKYVASGYVATGYVVGDSVSYDPNTAVSTNKKINFIVDNQGYDDANILLLLEDKVGGSYENDVNIVFGESLKIVEKKNGSFTFKEVAGGITDDELASINSEIQEAKDLATSANVNMLTDNSFLLLLANEVAKKLSLSLVGATGTIIESSLTFNTETSSYVFDYDTSLLDGTDYTIALKVIDNQ
jgi:hypothetical protein